MKEQESLTRKLYQEYRESVRDFLGIDSQKVISYIREIPQRGKWKSRAHLTPEGKRR